MTHQQVIDYSSKVLRRSGKRWRCFPIFKEVGSSNEIPDVLGFNSGASALIEAKVSRSDFLADKKKSFRKYPERAMGNYRFYACPSGLIKPNEIPENWGLIWISKKGRCTLKVKPNHQKADLRRERQYMYSMLRRTLIYMTPKQLKNFIKNKMDSTESAYIL